MATALAILGLITALAPVLFKILSSMEAHKAADHAKKQSLGRAESDELAAGMERVDQLQPPNKQS
jgi:hypothetical protein